MPPSPPTYAERLGILAHRSFFRMRLEQRARSIPEGGDRVHEYLIDQANLRGFFGAYSDRSDLGSLDEMLGLEEIIVGLLQPHAPAELRLLKLVLRILQSERVDLDRLMLLARRERALPMIAWLIEQVPLEERAPSVKRLAAMLAAKPPRELRRPDIRYDPARLRRRTRA